MCVCVCVCVYVCMYVCMYVCVRAGAHVHDVLRVQADRCTQTSTIAIEFPTLVKDEGYATT